MIIEELLFDSDEWDLRPETDPMRPPEEPVEVECWHCGRRYSSDAIVWDERWRLWVCPHHDECGGAGFRFDIWPVERKGRRRRRAARG